MNWFFKRKEYKDYYNEAYLLAVFSPKENLERLEKEYQSMRNNNANTAMMKAKMAGFMAGFEARNKSRIEKLREIQSKNKERDKNGYER